MGKNIWFTFTQMLNAKGSLTAFQDGRKSREANCMEMSSRPVPPNDTKPIFF